jgi:hypothetical protein
VGRTCGPKKYNYKVSVAAEVVPKQAGINGKQVPLNPNQRNNHSLGQGNNELPTTPLFGKIVEQQILR